MLLVEFNDRIPVDTIKEGPVAMGTDLDTDEAADKCLDRN